MEEIWKPISGYEGLYEVSSFGRVRSLDRINYYTRHGGKVVARKRSGKLLTPQLDGRGLYLHVGLSQNGHSDFRLVHRLVAQAFISNPHNYPEVNHKDENKTNNAVQNLEWCDHIYNNNYGSKLEQTRGVRNSMNKITPEIVKAIRASYSPRDKENSATALAERYGISATHVCAIVKGRRWGWL